MGWFRRTGADDSDPSNGDGFYRGDAPVLMPGVDGDAPSPYVSGYGRAPGTASHPPAPEHAPPPRAQHPYPPPGYPPPPQQAPPQYPPPQQAPPQYPPPQYRAPASSERTVRRVGLGCAVAIVVFVLLGVGGILLVAVSSFESSVTEDGEVATVVGAVDVPTTVRYDGTDLQITVGGTQAQPGPGWTWSQLNSAPHLVVAVSLQQQGRPLLTIPFTDWSFVPDGAAESGSVRANLISGYEPDLVTASLTRGAAVFGYLAFETPSTSGTLTLQGDYGDPPLASWKLTAQPAVVIAGTTGEPVRPQIGKPPFTVTLDTVTWVAPEDAVARRPPASGAYLITDLTLTATGQESSGIIERERFVFVAANGDAVSTVPPGVVQDTTTITSVVNGSTAPVRLAFDVPAGPGLLELRDPADRTIARWPIA